MSDKNRDALNAMASRLKKAQDRVQDPLTKPHTESAQKGSVLSLAFRVSIEIVSAVAIGFGIGWFVDDWLGAKPWFMVIFVLIGFAAGVLNVYRMASGFGYAAGYTAKDKDTLSNIERNEEN